MAELRFSPQSVLLSRILLSRVLLSPVLVPVLLSVLLCGAAAEDLRWDPRGYVLYCPCMGEIKLSLIIIRTSEVISY